MKYLLSLALLILPMAGSAATFYYSNCAVGLAHALCVNGSDAADGLTPATAKQTFTGVMGGNTSRFARGGAWISVQKGGPSNAILEDYTPASCIGGCATQKPIWQAATSGGTTVNMFFFNNGGGNSTFRNIDMRGHYDLDGKGLYLYAPDVSVVGAVNVVLDGVIIQGFDLGIHLTGGPPVHAGFVLKNSILKHNTAGGFLGGGKNTLIENNVFDANASDTSGKDPHHLYFSGQTQGVIARGNTLTNHNDSSTTDNSCSTVVIVAHGSHPDMIVENNTITEVGTTSGGCYGIDLNSNTSTSSTPQNFTRLIIRSNKMAIPLMGTGIGCSSCPNALIENNIIVRAGTTSGFTAINVPSSAIYQPARGDVADTKVTIRNNSIYADTSSTSLVGLRLALPTPAGGDVITNNLFFFGATSSASATCFNLNSRLIGTFAAVNNNICYRSGGSVWSTAHATLAAAQAAGFDTASSASDPGMTTPAVGNNYTIEATSGASIVINAANTTYRSRLGYRGKRANGARDIGACEYRTADACSVASPSVPSSPTNVR